MCRVIGGLGVIGVGQKAPVPAYSSGSFYDIELCTRTIKQCTIGSRLNSARFPVALYILRTPQNSYSGLLCFKRTHCLYRRTAENIEKEKDLMKNEEEARKSRDSLKEIANDWKK